MAGIVGVLGERIPAEAKARALSRLKHGPTFAGGWLHEADRVSIGAVHRQGAAPRVHLDDATGILVVAYGSPLIQAGGWRVPSAEELFLQYREEGQKALFGLDGSFVIVVEDPREGRLLVVNDRMASIPTQYARHGERVAFAPEAKALFPLLRMPPRLDREGLVAFLAMGHPVGDRTAFESIRLLPPAHVLVIDLEGGGISVSPYWDLRFREAGRPGLREAAEQLHSVLIDAHSAVLSDAPSRARLLLTGGYDSRTILGAMGVISRLPDEALTWGISGDIRGSDPEIARRMAEELNVPFRVLRYGAEDVPRRAEEWSWVCELSSDNMGSYAAGPRFLDPGATPGEVILVGDQMLGPHGIPESVADATEQVVGLAAGTLPRALHEVVSPERREAVAELFHRQLRQVVDRSGSRVPKDVQDYLFFHIYVFRWLLAPSYFREPMVTARRPLLLNTVVDFAAGLPQWLRVDKRVLLEVLRRKMPAVARFPKNAADSLVDWGYELRREESLRTLALELLEPGRLRATPLGELLDEDALGAFVTGFFAEDPAPASRRPRLSTRLFALRRQLSRTPATAGAVRALERMAKRALGLGNGRQAVPLVLRLAQVSLLQRLIENGRFDPEGTESVRDANA